MADSIKKSTKTGETKKIKVNSKKDVEKVVSTNKSTVITGKKSTAVRKKPVVKKINQEPSNEEKAINTNKPVKKTKATIKVATKKPVVKKVAKVTEQEVENIKEHAEIIEKEKKEIALENQFKEEKKEDVKLFDIKVDENASKKIEEESKEEDKKKPTVKKKVKIPGNRKAAITLAKNNKKGKKKPLTPEKNVKSVIKQEEPKEQLPVIEVKKDEATEIKSIKVDEVESIKKKAKASSKNKPKVTKVTPKVNVPKGKRVKSVYDPTINRWVVKEDKSKPPVSNKKKLSKVPIDGNDYTYELETGGLKSKFFEEVNVERFNEAKREKRRKLPKKILIFLLVVIILVSAGYIFYKKYQDKIKHDLNMYDVYEIGQEVKLKDDSTWYVAEKSDGSQGTVLLLSVGLIDINGDGSFDANDQKPYSSGEVKYDVKDESSIAYYLENEYKPIIEKKVGKINKISMIESKVFVKIRDKMGYGYEWKEDNILTSANVTGYFVATDHEKIYFVSRSGAYRLSKATDKHFIRYTIEVDKSLIKKEEKKQEKKEENKKEEKKTGQQ